MNPTKSIIIANTEVEKASPLRLSLPINQYGYSENNHSNLSSSWSDFTSSQLKILDGLRNELSSDEFTSSLLYSNASGSLGESLFDACTNVKIITSQISMHLKSGYREKLFHQLDLIHDIEAWDSDDKPINENSFKSFIKWLLQVRPSRGPGIGLTSQGNIVAAWAHDKNRLTVEFLTNDQAMWIVSKYYDGTIERASGETTLSRLSNVLSPYETEDFFLNE